MHRYDHISGHTSSRRRVHKSLQAHSHTHAHTCVVAVVVDGRVIYINTRTHLRCYCCGCWESHLQKHTHTCVVTVVVVGRVIHTHTHTPALLLLWLMGKSFTKTHTHLRCYCCGCWERGRCCAGSTCHREGGGSCLHRGRTGRRTSQHCGGAAAGPVYVCGCYIVFV